MATKKKTIPVFRNEDEEREFWGEHDSADYLDWKMGASVLFPKLKPSTKNISLRLTESMLEEIKSLANKRDVPYQSLMKVLLAKALKKEM